MNDHSNNRLTVLAPNGDFVKTVPILNVWGFGYTWDAYVNARGLIDEFVSVRKEGAQAWISARRVWSADYARIDTILPLDCPGVPKPDATDVNYRFRSSRGGMVMQIPFVSPRVPVARSIDGVDDGGGGEVDDTFLRADPAELGFGGEATPEAGHVGADAFNGCAFNQRGEGVNGGDAEFGAAAECEGEAVAVGSVGLVGVEDDVRGGVVGVLVHRVGAVAAERGGEADVECFDSGDVRWHVVR